jgi:two-component system chemotaxis response regulator CheB
MHMNKPVRVLIVDDSALIQQLLTELLSADPEIEVVGTAGDPYVARERIKELNPDVVTLDIEMPRMDGVTFLRKIMALRPMPVIMISTLTKAAADITLEALEAGAVDFVAKPTTNVANSWEELAGELQGKVKAAAQMRLHARPAPQAAAVLRRERSVDTSRKIVAIGASTGGVEALKQLLVNLPAVCPPILITQHMPPRFTAAFAERLNRECPMTVCEAAHNDVVQPNRVYIAAGSHHLELVRVAGRYHCSLNEGPPVSGHRPSVDVLFRSFARTIGSSAVGVILTGMGKDGSEGLLEMRQAGAVTLGQDEASSLIYGMPRVAFERGAVMRQFPLSRMADAILDACDEKVQPRSARSPFAATAGRMSEPLKT